jgi:CHAT domain-containing protein
MPLIRLHVLIVIIFLTIFFSAHKYSLAQEGVLGIIVANPAHIMDSKKTLLADVPKGTRLWIFRMEGELLEVKVPGKQQRGWLTKADIQLFQPTAAESTLLSATHEQLKKTEQLAKASKYAEAHQIVDESITVVRKVFGSESPLIGKLYSIHGDLYKQAGDLNNAQTKYESARLFYIEVLGEEHPSVARTLISLSDLARSQGDYQSAKKFMIDSLKIKLESGDTERSELADNLRTAGILCSETDDLLKARFFLEQALEMQRQLPNQDELASTLNSLGVVFAQQGNFVEAKKSYDEALKIQVQTLGPDNANVADTLNNLGTLALDQSKYEEAQEYLQQAVNIKRKVLGNDDLHTAKSIINLAIIMDLQKKYDEAKILLNEVLKIQKKNYGNDHPDIAATLNNLGKISVASKDYDLAVEQLGAALKIRQRMLGENHSETVTTLLNLLLLEVKRKNDRLALKYADQINHILHTQLQQVVPGLEEYAQLLYLEQKFQPIWLECLALGWLKRTDQNAVATSEEWLLNGKSITQEILGARTLLTRGSTDQDLVKQVNRLQMVRQQLAALTISGKVTSAKLDSQQSLNQLVEQEQLLAKQVAQRNGYLGYSQEWQSLDKLRSALPADSTYIDIIRTQLTDYEQELSTEAHYLAWIIPPLQQGEPKIVDLGSALDIDSAIDTLRASIAESFEPNGSLSKLGEVESTAKLDQELQLIAKLAWLPLQPFLGNRKQVILSPDGALWLLPWSVLPTQKNRLLIEDYSVQLVLSGRDLLKRPANQHSSTAPAIFANPNYNLTSDNAQARLANLLPDLKLSFPKYVGQQIPPLRVSDLPSTALESDLANPIFSKLTNSKTLVFVRDDALELVAEKLKNPRYLYFATHGFFLPDQQVQPKLQTEKNIHPDILGTSFRRSFENPLLRCGLLLSGCNSPRTAGLDDGILTGMEIVSMDLRGTELVVLSACETGIGKVRNGEGVAGLRQAFQLAGAQSVVSTLWQVPDRDSALIMRDFLTNLAAGQAKPEALRNAQLTRIAARKEKFGAAHPFFWAAWTVTGE